MYNLSYDEYKKLKKEFHKTTIGKNIFTYDLACAFISIYSIMLFVYGMLELCYVKDDNYVFILLLSIVPLSLSFIANLILKKMKLEHIKNFYESKKLKK